MAAGVKAEKRWCGCKTGDVSLHGLREQGEELTAVVSTGSGYRCRSVFALRRSCVEYTVPEVSQSPTIPVWKGVRQYRRANNWRRSPQSPDVNGAFIFRRSVFIGGGSHCRRLSATTPVAVIQARLPSPESQTVRGTLADISDKRTDGIRARVNPGLNF
ncbi:hypothetical protein KCP78_09335 [Salmonella enterica subsp. enterica]|nr:hypothetical protein KCP78_09335 [Salmonella enterica subsp. enterica]